MKLNIIIPAYNEEKRIEKTLESYSQFFLDKMKNDFEILIILNGCRDKTREIIEKFTDKGLYPYAKFYLRDIKERRGTYWSNHFATIGLVGMNECLLNLLGKDITDASAHEFAKEALAYMRERLVKYQEETGNLYNLEATPAEGTAYRLARLDKKAYPDKVVLGFNCVRIRLNVVIKSALCS